MDTPLIDKLIAGDTRLLNLFTESKKGLEERIAAGVIYNTELKDAYHFISRAIELAFDKATEPYRGERDQWEDNDPRWYTVYHPAPANAGSAYKKLLKYKGTAPRIDAILPVFEEAAKLIDLTKKAKPLVVKGRKPNPNVKPIDTSNTAHCAICGNRQKLSKGKTMVDHGFQISDGLHYFGYRSGHCFGVNYQPYELSCEANKKFVVYLRGELANTEKGLAQLQSGEVNELHVLVSVRDGFKTRKESKTLHRGDEGFDREEKRRIAQAEQQIDYLKSDIQIQEAKIRDWKPVPLEN